MVHNTTKADLQRFEKLQFIKQKRAELNNLVDFHNLNSNSNKLKQAKHGSSVQIQSDHHSRSDEEHCEYLDVRQQQQRRQRHPDKVNESNIFRKQPEQYSQRLDENSIVNINLSKKPGSVKSKDNFLVTEYTNTMQGRTQQTNQMKSVLPKTKNSIGKGLRGEETTSNGFAGTTLDAVEVQSGRETIGSHEVQSVRPQRQRRYNESNQP